MSKKDSLIADAQKFLQKGQADKALSCYQEALKADPGDQRLRLRLAELFVKCRYFDEARKEFEAIGRNLSSSGFYLRAIAVYKQIEKLFPEDIGIALTLASLNEQHGLSANALSEYKRAYDYFEQLQNFPEALKALEAMQRIDAHNPNIKLKYAEVLFQHGDVDAALEAFRSLGFLLVERRDEVAFARLAGRISQLFPDKPDFSCSVIEQKINDGNAEHAAALLQPLIKGNPQRYAAWRLLILAYKALENTARLQMVCQHAVKLFPEELFPRKALIECLIESQDTPAALAVLDESELLFVRSGEASFLRQSYLRLNDLVPINIRILKGCARTCELAGNSEEAASFAAKIGSLAGLGGNGSPAPSEDEPLGLALDLLTEDTDAVADEIELDVVPEISFGSPAEAFSAEPEPDLGTRELDVAHFAESAGGDDSGFYEIEVELDDDFGDLPLAPANAWFDTVNDIFDSIPTESGKVRFGDGIDNGDARSQYDLGLAFYEMGLFDEAIVALRQASEDPERRVSCLILQGACLRDKGELQHAESVLTALLESPSLTLEDTCALKYELALTCSALGKEEQAHRYFHDVELLNPAFRDVGKRLNPATGAQDESFDFDEDELLDFELK